MLRDLAAPEAHLRSASFSVALVSRDGLAPGPVAELAMRLVRQPHEVHRSDDVVLFYGPCMAKELRRFSAQATAPLPPAVVFAPRLDWDDVCAALDNGAVGYLLENRYSYLLGEALLCAVKGASVLDPAIAAEQVRLASKARSHLGVLKPAEPQVEGQVSAICDRLRQLSRRERQVLELLSAGSSMRDAAREIGVTEKTIRTYLSRIYPRLGVHSRTEAILMCLGRLKSNS